jgi:hypothetical protein
MMHLLNSIPWYGWTGIGFAVFCLVSICMSDGASGEYPPNDY